jgi:hypothetical protein
MENFREEETHRSGLGVGHRGSLGPPEISEKFGTTKRYSRRLQPISTAGEAEDEPPGSRKKHRNFETGNSTAPRGTQIRVKEKVWK